MLKELIESLSKEETEKLELVLTSSSTITNKIIDFYLQNPEIQQAQIEEKIKINSNSYFKNVTLAKDLIYEIIKKENTTTYDDIFLVRTLIFRGLYIHANKLILKLEEKYLYEKWYGLLDVLYHESFRIAYNSCDVKTLEKLNEKVKINLEKYHEYTLLDKQLLLEMARSEKHDIKLSEINTYTNHIQDLYKKCFVFQHHVLEFNALHCLYQVHVNYTNDFNKAFEVVVKIKTLVETNKERMNERIYANMLTHVAFPYCIYEINKDSVSYFEYLFDYFKSINHHFILSEVLLNYSIYHFTKNEDANLNKMYQLLMPCALEKNDQYKESFVASLIAFQKADFKLFHQHKTRFYNSEQSRDFLSCDLLLRNLDILVLIKANEIDIAFDKIDATEKFMKRNFSIARVEEDKSLFQLFRKKIKGKNVETEKLFAHRFGNFIFNELSR